MMKRICTALAALVLLCCLASCGSSTTPTAKGDLAAVVGMYQSGECAVTIDKASGDTVSVYAMLADGILNATEWKLTGTFDPQTNRITYSDCACKHVTYDEHGYPAEETVKYENGTGVLQFADDGSFTWQSASDADSFDGMTFAKLTEAE